MLKIITVCTRVHACPLRLLIGIEGFLRVRYPCGARIKIYKKNVYRLCKTSTFYEWSVWLQDSEHNNIKAKKTETTHTHTQYTALHRAWKVQLCMHPGRVMLSVALSAPYARFCPRPIVGLILIPYFDLTLRLPMCPSLPNPHNTNKHERKRCVLTTDGQMRYIAQAINNNDVCCLKKKTTMDVIITLRSRGWRVGESWK